MSWRLGALLTVVLCISWGCRSSGETVVSEPPGRARVIKPAVATTKPKGPPRVDLQVVFAQRPEGDQTLNEQVWQPADEAILPLELQERLQQQGFRIGMFAGQPPHGLELMLREAPRLTFNGHHLQLPSGQSTTVVTVTHRTAPSVVAQLLDAAPEQLGVVKCVFEVVPTLQPDDSIQLHITPVIQYGKTRRRFVPEVGPGGVRQWTLEITPDAHALDDLAWRTVVREGDFLMISCLPQSEGTIGHAFFVDQQSRPPRQMLMILHAMPASE